MSPDVCAVDGQSHPGRCRNFQSSTAVPLTIGPLGNPGTPPFRAATPAARQAPAPAPVASTERRGRRRPIADSAGFAIGRLPLPIAGFLGLKNKLSLQGLAGEVMTIIGESVSLK